MRPASTASRVVAVPATVGGTQVGQDVDCVGGSKSTLLVGDPIIGILGILLLVHPSRLLSRTASYSPATDATMRPRFFA
jgi:hypothetical protein